MPLDTNLHACGREANFVTMTRLKRRLPSDVFRPKKKASEAISEHQIFQNFPEGACMPPDPRSLILRIQYRTKAGPMQFDFAEPEFS